MCHTKFQDRRSSGSGEEILFTIYSHGSHLGHVTLTIYINFLFPFPRMLHVKFGFDWPSGFRENVSKLWKYTCYSPGAGADKSQGPNFSRNIINFLSMCLFPVSFTHLMPFYHFPHSNALAT